MLTHKKNQQGSTLTVVLSLLLVTAILMGGGMSLLNLKQRSAADEADRLRAMEAAQALLLDAEQDILHPTFRTGTNPFFPLRLGEYDTVRLRIAASSALGCTKGICTPSDLSQFDSKHWRSANDSSDFWKTGAYYGEFTGADDSSTKANLTKTLARYWVEVWVYDANNQSQSPATSPDGISPFVYRITAVAKGQRAGTLVVLQTLFIPVTQ